MIGERGDELERRDLPKVPPPDVETPLMVARMREALEGLPPRERQVLEMRWGLTGEEHTFLQVAQAFGIARATAHQIEARALRRLRKTLGGRRAFRGTGPLGRQ